jgi:hypothetical protein
MREFLFKEIMSESFLYSKQIWTFRYMNIIDLKSGSTQRRILQDLQ